MATETAPPRRLWQLPTFLVGLASLLALWHSGDRIRPSLPERYEKAMLVLRPAVDRWPPDPDQVRAALRKLPEGEPPADMVPKIRYLKGSAYVALAESTTSPQEAAENWELARKELEAAADHDLPLPDQKKLRYRLARVWAHTPGTDPHRTIEALQKYVSAGDDPSEGYRLLAELHRTTNPINEVGERDSLQNFLRHASPRADAKMLNGARLRLAELHTKMNMPEEARKVLERVGPEAPPEMYAAARLRRGAIHWQEEEHGKAAQEWEAVRGMKGATEDQRAEAMSKLAEAYVKLGRGVDAESLVKELGSAASGEGRLVAFRQAEAAFQDPKGTLDNAVALWEKALAGFETDSASKAILPADAKRVCEAGFAKTQAGKQFALSLRIANAYSGVAHKGDHYRFLADAKMALAEQLSKESAASTEALTHYREGAEASIAAAKADGTPTGAVDWLRKAVNGYVRCNETVKVVGVLTDLSVRLNDYPAEKAGEVWAEVGEGFAAAGVSKQAIRAFQNASLRPGPKQSFASIRLASLEFEADPQTGGEKALTMLNEVLSRTPTPGDTSIEQARFLVGEVQLLRKDWEKAEAELKAALNNYPNSPRAARARYQYGQVLRHNAYESARKLKADRATLEQIKKERLANRQPGLKIDEHIRIEDGIDRAQKKYEESMRLAYEEFRKAEEAMIANPEAADAEVVKRTSFWTADCAYWLGEYGDCSSRLEKLAVRYRGKVEELEAYRDLQRCSQFAVEGARQAKDAESEAAWAKKGKDARAKVQELLPKIAAAEWDGKSETRRQEYWDSWLANVNP